MDGSAQLTEVRFSKKRQGYDPDEVDNFLERVGEKVYELQEKIKTATERAETSERRAQEAQRRAEAAEEQAATALQSSIPDASGTTDAPASKSAEVEDLEETLKNTLVLAQRTADAAIKEATAESTRIVAEAKERADRLNSETDNSCREKIEAAEREAQKRIEAASGPIKSEVLRLEERQGRLTDEVTALEVHLEAQRGRIADALTTLRAVLDDPKRFSVDPRPATSNDDKPATTSTDRPSTAKAAREPTSEPAGAHDEPLDLTDKPAPAETPVARQPARSGPAPAAPTASAAPTGPPAGSPPRPIAAREPLAARRPSVPTAGTAAGAAAAAAARPTMPPTPRPTARPTPVDPGPPTAQIDLTSEPPMVDDGNFLDELRRAVGDPDEGTTGADEADDAMQAFFEQRDSDLEPDRRRSRFGRRH